MVKQESARHGKGDCRNAQMGATQVACNLLIPLNRGLIIGLMNLTVLLQSRRQSQ